MIYTYSNFGYEGDLIQVETILRSGIPSVDIVGLSDGMVSESRAMITCAVHSELEMPCKRVLISLSPTDKKKDGAGFDFAMAVSLVNPTNHDVMVIGELMLNGSIEPVSGARTAAECAIKHGIKYIVCSVKNYDEIKDIEGLSILAVGTFKETIDKIGNVENFKASIIEEDCEYFPSGIGSFDDVEGMGKSKRAMAVAIAGKLNILAYGEPGCGKTRLMQLSESLVPNLTRDEYGVTSRIRSITGLSYGKERKAPFRIPYQTASIEGIYGGGLHCHPGEISLAHNGILFLDEAGEFKSSVLQMLRVPLESHQITLSRAGRSTVYPADFQLFMTANPCPCGNYGFSKKVCLCSAKSVELYWSKFSALLDKIHIKLKVENNDEVKISHEQMKSWVKNAYDIQRKRGVFNGKMNASDILEINMESHARDILETHTQNNELSSRWKHNCIATALTIANMDARENVTADDIKEAIELTNPITGIQKCKNTLKYTTGC